MQYIPSISADFSYIFSGSQFPLQDGRFNIGLNFSFSNFGSPVNTSISYGSGVNSGSNRGMSTEIHPLETINYNLNKKQMSIALQESLIQKEKQLEDLRFQTANALESYNQLKTRLQLKKESLSMEQMKYLIMEKKHELGEIKQLEMLYAHIELAETEIELLSDILSLILAEREIEKLIGLKPGELRKIDEQI